MQPFASDKSKGLFFFETKWNKNSKKGVKK